MTIGLLHPGEMGSMVGMAARASGARVLWLARGRGASYRRPCVRRGLGGCGKPIGIGDRQRRDPLRVPSSCGGGRGARGGGSWLRDLRRCQRRIAGHGSGAGCRHRKGRRDLRGRRDHWPAASRGVPRGSTCPVTAPPAWPPSSKAARSTRGWWKAVREQPPRSRWPTPGWTRAARRSFSPSVPWPPLRESMRRCCGSGRSPNPTCPRGPKGRPRAMLARRGASWGKWKRSRPPSPAPACPTDSTRPRPRSTAVSRHTRTGHLHPVDEGAVRTLLK